MRSVEGCFCTHETNSNRTAYALCQGMGEPLNNYNAVRDAVSMMTHSQVFGLSRKHVTISTVGVVPRLRDLANDMPVSQERNMNSTLV